MSAFVANILISLGSAIAGWLAKEFHIYQQTKAAEKATAAAAAAQKAAVTPAQIDQASKDISAGF